MFKFFDKLYFALLIGYFISFAILWLNYLAPKSFNHCICQNPYFFLDYTRYYVFAQITDSDQNQNLYNPQIQKQFFSKAIYPAKPNQFFSQYPPQTGILMHPLKFLPLNYGYATFIIISIILLITALLNLRNKLNPIDNLTFLTICFGIFASMPMLWSILLGQVNIILVAAIIFLLLANFKHKYIMGLCSSLCLSIKPHYFIFFFPLSLFMKNFKFFLSCLAVNILLLLYTFKTFKPSIFTTYVNMLSEAESKFAYLGVKLPDFANDTNYLITIRKLLMLFLPTNNALHISIIMFGLAFCLAAYLCLRNNWKRSENTAWLISSLILIYLVFSPHAHFHDSLLLSVVACSTLSTLALDKIFKLKLNLKIWHLVFYFYPILTWLGFLCLPHDSGFREYFFLIINSLLLIISLNQNKLFSAKL